LIDAAFHPDRRATAKARFRTAWTELQSQISYAQIREVRVIEADRSRPWHQRRNE
jgi:hypothetical protein